MVDEPQKITTGARVHLDLVGGIAGDMFAAALLDADPTLARGALRAVRASGLPASVRCAVVAHHDHTLTGARFVVDPGSTPPAADHVPHAAIEAQLRGSGLEPAVSRRASAIFRILAEAEAAVHGVAPAEVTFHEVGAWDSIADIVCAAYLIEALGDVRWSAGPIPLGSGRVQSAHGSLPVPAPAVARLLEGFAVHDDGLIGERVTPTGAAILRHLAPDQAPARVAERLTGVGTGFGTKLFPGLSNVLRAVVFAPLSDVGIAGAGIAGDEVAELRFAIDDQTPEDLALGLEGLRAQPGVLDVVQWPAYGKKGRLVAEVQILAEAEALDAVLAGAFGETTTLGVRWRLVRRSVLAREITRHTDVEGAVRVKRAHRPAGGGRAETAKAEIDDLAGSTGGHAGREARRRRAETAPPGGDRTGDREKT